MAADFIEGSDFRDKVFLGSGSQSFDGGEGGDVIISYADGGEPDPAQTDGADGRVNPAIAEGMADDTLTGGAGGDRFEFRALINAREEVLAQHTSANGSVNWRRVAGENDSVHDHWVEGFGNDTITDYSKAEGDKIVIRGHTVDVASIEYGSDAGGDYSLITVISQQGNGGAGGANTATGAHDEDPLGTIKVYGDTVTIDDICVKAAGVFDGIDRLARTDAAYPAETDAGAVQVVYSNTDGDSYTGGLAPQMDVVTTGAGSQTVNTGGGNDIIRAYSDGGEPDPAQTDGAEGRVNPSLGEGAGDDVFAGGQGRDTFLFNFLINAKDEILDRHTRSNGSIDWRGVAGENGNVHDHWVEGIGDDVILDYSKQDGDCIVLRGHTVEIADIVYGEDEGGDYSLILVRSQQGDNGGAHDEDPLGSIKVYGDTVTADDIKVQKSNVFDGIDKLEAVSAGEALSPADNEAPAIEEIQWGAENPESIDLTFTGTLIRDVLQAGSGRQTVHGGAGNDVLISWADGGEPDPAQTEGADGRVNPALPEGAADDVFTGGSGRDTFEFRALINAKREVVETHTNNAGKVNWRRVAGENDNVHDHWVEGFGNDTITDYSRAEGDKIVIRGHTVDVASIEYGTDEDGDFSLITVISQQGNGGAGGANTATGAHDEDPLGTIKVYGDEVTIDDICVKAGGVVDGIDRLQQADKLAGFNGGVQAFASSVDGDTIETQDASVRVADYVVAGAGRQTVSTGAGNDAIVLTSDGGEPDPAQTDGADGRINPAILPGTANDTVSGGQGRDAFVFNLLINATAEVIARHSRADGSVNWRRVAGENDAVHDHWVEGIGDDTILDYSKQDGDRIVIRGHTVEIADITYGEDANGDYSIVTLRSQQGDNGGAHDEDPLGTIRIYGDQVTADDIKVQAGVFDGIDQFDLLPASGEIGLMTPGTRASETLTGTAEDDIVHGFGGSDVILGLDGDDHLFGGSGRDTVEGGAGDDWLEGDGGRDRLVGGTGRDTLVADAGRDVLIGGADGDTFVFTEGTRGASVVGFEDGLDLIDLTRIDGIDSIDDIALLQTSDTSVTVAYLNGNDDLIGITVTGQPGLTLDASDFLL